VSADAGQLAKLGADGRGLGAAADLDARYVNVTGDSMSGGLTVSGGRSSFAATNEPFALGARHSAGGGAVYFGATNSTATPSVQISASSGVAVLTIDATGNLSSPGASHTFADKSIKASAIDGLPTGGLTQTDADARYVNVTGDTMTGALTVERDGAASTVGITAFADAGNAVLRFQRSRGTKAVPTALQANDYIGRTNFVTNDSSGTPRTSAFSCQVQSISATGVETAYNFIVTNLAGATVTPLLVTKDGISITGNITSTGTSHTFAAKSIQASAIDGLPTGGLTQTEADARYVNITGDTMTGALVVSGARSSFAALNEPYAVGLLNKAGGLPNYIGTATDDSFQVSNSGGLPMLTLSTAGAWSSGSLAIGGAGRFSAKAPLDVDASTMRVRQSKTPSSQTDTGEPGTVCWDTAYLYACISQNQWRRIPWRDWNDGLAGAVQWSPISTASAPLYGVSFGGNQFVADAGKWSVDGINWFAGSGLPVLAASTWNTGQGFTKFAYGNGTYVTLLRYSAGSSAQFYTSSDGKAWTLRNTSVGGGPCVSGQRAVGFGAGRFVALINNSGASLGNVLPRYSTDGINWTASAAPSGLVANTLSNIEGVAYSGASSGQFVAVGHLNGTAVSRYLTSTDGISWTARSLPVSGVWADVAFGNGRYVAIAPGLVALTSVDGLNWTQVTMPASADWSNLAYGAGKWVAVASGTSLTAQSSDGITWTASPLPSASAWNGVACNGTVFVATNGTSTPAVLTTTPQLVTYFPITVSRDLVSSDAEATVANVSTGAAPVTITIPDDGTLAFPVGTSITVMDASATAATTIKASASVTLNWSGKLVGTNATVLGGAGVEVQIPGPLSQVVLRKVAVNSWTIIY